MFNFIYKIKLSFFYILYFKFNFFYQNYKWISKIKIKKYLIKIKKMTY